jgi:8-oxo-dGTP diphosphatase
MNSDVVLRVAAKALIVNDADEVLLVREANTYDEGTNLGKYQIPGGRLNPGESYAEGLHREVFEETGLKIKPLHPIYVGEWKPVIKGIQHHIVAIFTVCRAKTRKVTLSEEHDHYMWVHPKKISRLKISITDPEPEVLKRFLKWEK